MTEYKYTDLKSPTSIRLLNLLPGRYEEELRCELWQRELEHAGVFECVSYVWGDVSDRSRITICTKGNGDSLQSLLIPKNLDLGLRRFRSEVNSRILWADSICINQENIDERSSQVRIMGQIYMKAETVLIWLGEESEPGRAEAASRCMKLLSQDWTTKFDYIRQKSWVDDLRKEDEPESLLGEEQNPYVTDNLHQKLEIPLLTSKEFQSMRSLICNSWFTRAWTWQESFAAKQRLFHWSSWTFEADVIRGPLLLIYNLGENIVEPLYLTKETQRAFTMVINESFWGTEKILSTLPVLLSQRRSSACKEPSDQVYSLLGAAQGCPDVPVDYKDPFATTYARTAFLIIEQSKSLGILSLVEDRRSDADLPSWVPDWRVKDPKVVLFTMFGPRDYAATGSSTVRAKLSASTRVLQVSGLHFETIIDTKTYTFADYVRWREGRPPPGKADTVRYPYTNETCEQVMLRTALVDRTAFEPADEMTRWRFDTFDEIDRIMANADNCLDSDGRKYHSFFVAFNKCTSTMVFFTTSSGHIGIAHKTAKVGDEIVFLCGAEVPFLLRRRGQARRRNKSRPDGIRRRSKTVKTYQFVAECYVHGSMDGEAFVEARQDARPEEEMVDDSWLDTIGDRELPFPLSEFHIV